MRKLITLICFLASVCCFGDFYDDFTAAQVTNNNHWDGDTSKFIINEDYSLQLYDTSGLGGNVYLSARLPGYQAGDSLRWDFNLYIGYNPSRENYVRIYLASDQPKLNDELNGYFILIGGTDDKLALMCQQGKKTQQMISFDRLFLNDYSFIRVCVELTSSNDWYLSYSLDKAAAVHSDVFNQTPLAGCCYLGMNVVYTKTRSKLTMLDMISFKNLGRSPSNPSGPSEPDEPDTPQDPTEEDPQAEIPAARGFTLATEYLSLSGSDGHSALNINYNLDEQEHNVNLFIYNVQGQKLCRLLHNEPLSGSGLLTLDAWQEGMMRQPGLYILLAEIRKGSESIRNQKILLTVIP